MVVSVTITLNTLKYTRKTLILKTLVYLYSRPLDCSNITYIIALITSFSFNNLDFLIPPKISSINNIEKTINFIDNEKKDITLEKYLQTFLSNNLKDKNKKIIISFLLILEAKIKTDWLEDFINSNTKIIIYTDTTKIGVDILNIRHVIQ